MELAIPEKEVKKLMLDIREGTLKRFSHSFIYIYSDSSIEKLFQIIHHEVEEDTIQDLVEIVDETTTAVEEEDMAHHAAGLTLALGDTEIEVMGVVMIEIVATVVIDTEIIEAVQIAVQNVNDRDPALETEIVAVITTIVVEVEIMIDGKKIYNFLCHIFNYNRNSLSSTDTCGANSITFVDADQIVS